jgi:hypothetical protein
MTAAQIVPALLIPLVLWRVYSRVRRNIGRQPWRPRRLRGAGIFVSIVTALIALAAARFPSALGALGGGLVLAVPLGLFGLRLTRFDFSNGQQFYTPNTALGLAVTLLFIGRIIYRVVTLLGASHVDGPPPSVFQNPLTLLVFGLTAGYYITYYFGVLSRGQKELRVSELS